MEINNTKNIKIKHLQSFKGYQPDKTDNSKEEEQISSYSDINANDAVTAMGKSLVNIQKKDDNIELPQSIKKVLVRDKCDTDETFNKRNVLIKSLYANREELELSEKTITNLAWCTIGGENQDIAERLDLAELLCFNKDFPRRDIVYIIANTCSNSAEYTKELVLNKDFPNEYVKKIYRACIDMDKDKFRRICFSGEIPYENMAECLNSSENWGSDEFKKAYSALHEELYFDKDLDFPKEYIPDILSPIRKGGSKEFRFQRLKLAKILCEDKDFPKDKISGILENIENRCNNVLDSEVVGKLICERIIPDEDINKILFALNEYTEESLDCARYLSSDKNIPNEDTLEILGNIEAYNKKTSSSIKDLYKDKDLPNEYKLDIVKSLNYYDEQIPELAKALYKDKEIPQEDVEYLISAYNSDNCDQIIKLCKDYKKLEILPNQIATIVKARLSSKQIQKVNSALGYEKVSQFKGDDLELCSNLIDSYGKTNINELSVNEKRDLLKGLVSCNADMFNARNEIKELFPLIPKNQEEYCSLLPSLVKSLGIESKKLNQDQINNFHNDLSELSRTLKSLEDEEFNQLEITQEYPKDDFIKTVHNKIKDLPKNEQQKVYDYFGFELHQNKQNPTNFSITGYPINIKNGEKLSQIDSAKTKAVIEELRQDVINFSENNRIKCNNPEIEQLLNNIVKVLPEIRPMIGKKQHSTHDFDVFKHSLKVIQKISQDPNFDKLNDSDKKIILLEGLLHDITKKEGFSDKTHATESGFDTFFITKKFNLSQDEEIKLYTLIRNHEWLASVNTSENKTQMKKNLQSVAYDLQHNNTFDMALMFAHADLKAVKNNDRFHDTKDGRGRKDFNGNVRSFGESADLYGKQIKELIGELKKSQPLLPTTQIPSADRINDVITVVNPDGSTNIKGVYKNKDGLVVIKYNEVEDWEKIGFPKGSISHGIEVKAGEKGDAELNEDVNTGNIKFIVHGLDYENQLAKFDAFALIDSDALLSVSYTERPESKYRFFRPQGVILDVDSEYIHGGGNTDSGSGFGKDINKFKTNYIFGGEEESDRVYVSNLIKKVTGMSDEEYVEFVEKNKNKQMSEIEPPELQNKLIKAFSTINSNTRKGNRSYNEMYISNPKKVSAVFAYNIDKEESIDNPIEFLNRKELGENEKGYNGAESKSVSDRTKFLQEYALKNNIPFIVFGD